MSLCTEFLCGGLYALAGGVNTVSENVFMATTRKET